MRVLVRWWWGRWTRSTTGERAVLVVGVLSVVFAGLLTWDMVLYRGVAVELTEEWARIFAKWGEMGVLAVCVLKIVPLVLVWGFWPPLSVVVSTAFALDLSHDLVVWSLGSNVLLPLLGGPELVLGFLLALLLVKLRLVRA